MRTALSGTKKILTASAAALLAVLLIMPSAAWAETYETGDLNIDLGDEYVVYTPDNYKECDHDSWMYPVMQESFEDRDALLVAFPLDNSCYVTVHSRYNRLLNMSDYPDDQIITKFTKSEEDTDKGVSEVLGRRIAEHNGCKYLVTDLEVATNYGSSRVYRLTTVVDHQMYTLTRYPLDDSEITSDQITAFEELADCCSYDKAVASEKTGDKDTDASAADDKESSAGLFSGTAGKVLGIILILAAAGAVAYFINKTRNSIDNTDDNNRDRS